MAKLSTSKWTKYKFLRKSAPLRPHLPETLWLTEKAFWHIMDKYGEAIIKPTGSYGGKGVIRVQLLGNGQYEVHDGPRKKKLASRSDAAACALGRRGRNYLVQQRIPLVTVSSRPFDLRVMVQRGAKSGWKVTGTLAKVAGKGFIVTNMQRSSGTILSFEQAIARSVLKKRSTAELGADIDRVALLSARKLHKYYPWIRTIGVDMGLDASGKPWIIEVNFAPMLELFLKLKDKSIYRKLVAHGKK